MGINSVYRPLFHMQILHHYFLDEGNDVFDDGLSVDKMKKNLQAYNVTDFLSIIPTQKTVQLIKNWRGKFTLNNDGFSVLLSTDKADPLKPFISFDGRFVLDFLIEFKDPYFENYTDISIDRSKLFMIANKPPEESVGEKAIGLLFRKVTKFRSQQAGNDKTVDLSHDIQSSELVGKFGFIRLELEGANGEVDLVDNQGGFIDPVPEIKIAFKNRRTFWQYIQNSDGITVHETNGKRPLTKNGYIETKKNGVEYPNPSVKLIYKGDVEQGEDASSFYSKTFI